MTQMRIVKVNEQGLRIGEDHQNALLTDAECELIRKLREGGMKYTDIAEKFEISKSTVADIVKFRRRAQHATEWRKVRVKDPEPDTIKP